MIQLCQCKWCHGWELHPQVPGGSGHTLRHALAPHPLQHTPQNTPMGWGMVDAKHVPLLLLVGKVHPPPSTAAAAATSTRSTSTSTSCCCRRSVCPQGIHHQVWQGSRGETPRVENPPVQCQVKVAQGPTTLGQAKHTQGPCPITTLCQASTQGGVESGGNGWGGGGGGGTNNFCCCCCKCCLLCLQLTQALQGIYHPP